MVPAFVFLIEFVGGALVTISQDSLQSNIGCVCMSDKYPGRTLKLVLGHFRILASVSETIPYISVGVEIYRYLEPA